ncbi:MAG: glycosyltransferase [Sulfobacillus sp.]
MSGCIMDRLQVLLDARRYCDAAACADEILSGPPENDDVYASLLADRCFLAYFYSCRYEDCFGAYRWLSGRKLSLDLLQQLLGNFIYVFPAIKRLGWVIREVDGEGTVDEPNQDRNSAPCEYSKAKPEVLITFRGKGPKDLTTDCLPIGLGIGPPLVFTCDYRRRVPECQLLDPIPVSDDFDWISYCRGHRELRALGRREAVTYLARTRGLERRCHRFDGSVGGFDCRRYASFHPRLLHASPAEVLSDWEQRRGTYLVVTIRGFPFGGGEEFMMTTMEWMFEAGFDCHWVSFDGPLGSLPKLHREPKETGARGLNFWTCAQDAFSADRIMDWLYFLRPQVLHTQGSGADLISRSARRLSVRTLRGYHFWGELVDLGHTGNVEILRNLQHHRICRKYLEQIPGVESYVVSEFMNQVIRSLGAPPVRNVLPPLSDVRKFAVGNYDFNTADCITIINIDSLKGGSLAVHLLEKTNLPLLLVDNYQSDDPVSRRVRQLANRPGATLLPYQKDMSAIYRRTRLMLIPYQVDETFGKVAYEVLANGIPFLTSPCGNLGNLFKDFPDLSLDPNDLEKWSSLALELYRDAEKLAKIRRRIQSVELPDVESTRESFMRLSVGVRVMIFCPWCDQGLGIQSRTYTRILRKAGHRVFVFSHRPGLSAITGDCLQANPSEWENVADEVRYSDNYREDVSDQEITEFVENNDIDVCIIPEITLRRVFGIAELLSNIGVRVLAIPNVEMVRRPELDGYWKFDRVLAPSHALMSCLSTYGVNSHYIGHGVPFEGSPDRDASLVSAGAVPLRFLHLAGTNPKRKQTEKVIRSFLAADAKFALNARLTVAIEIPQFADEVKELCHHPKIECLPRHLSYDEVTALYRSHDVSIQVSSHEGIGLGFYESLSYRVPVISLDHSPHNEVVLDGVTGWLLPCRKVPMPDNDDGIIEAASFDEDALADMLNRLSGKPEAVTKLRNSLEQTFEERFSEARLASRLLPHVTAFSAAETQMAERETTDVSVSDSCPAAKKKRMLMIGCFALADGYGAFAHRARSGGWEVSFFPLHQYLNEGREYRTDLRRELKQSPVELVLYWVKIDRIHAHDIQMIRGLTAAKVGFFNWDPSYLPIERPLWEAWRQHSEEICPLLDFYFTVNPYEVECLRGRGNVLYCPPGFDPEVHHPKAGCPTYEVSFVLTDLYTDYIWDRHRQRANRKDYLDSASAAGIALTCYGPSEGLQNYGEGFSGYRGFCPYAETAEVFYGSKINLCLHAISIDGYFSERLPQILGTGGGVLLTDVEIGNNFVPGRDYLLLDPKDPIGQLRQALADEVGRKKMAERGREKALKHLTWDRLVGYLDQELEYWN